MPTDIATLIGAAANSGDPLCKELGDRLRQATEALRPFCEAYRNKPAHLWWGTDPLQVKQEDCKRAAEFFDSELPTLASLRGTLKENKDA